MIIEQKKNENLHIRGFSDVDTHVAEIGQEQLAWIMKVLSENYKDKYGIVVQEYSSNSWDSHVEAGCTNIPIIIKMGYVNEDKLETPYLQFIDKGVGLSPERIKIFGNYGDSTKRDSDEALGGFGLGSKSGYAYTDSFQINTTYDGIHYQYVAAKNNKGLPSITLIDKYEVQEDNYSMITFFIEPNDIRDFSDAIFRKTCYFENIAYDISNNIQNRFSYNLQNFNFNENDVFTLKDTNYVLLKKNPYREVHIILGQIPYTLDWRLLGRSPINIPIGIRIPISSKVKPIYTREDINYDQEAIDEINKELDKLIKYLTNRYYEDLETEFDNLEDYLNARWKLNSENKILSLGDINLNLNAISNLQNITPTFTKLSTLGAKLSNNIIISFLFYPFKIIRIIDSYNHGSKKPSHERLSKEDFLKDAGNIYQVQKGFAKTRRIVNDYIYHSTKVYGNIYLVNNTIDKIPLKKTSKSLGYYELLKLVNHPKSKWREIIVQYQKFINEWADKIPFYENVEVTEDYEKIYKEKQKAKRASLTSNSTVATRDEEDLVVYKLRPSQRGSGYTWDKYYELYSTLKGLRGFVIYGPTKYKDDIALVHECFIPLSNVTILCLNQKNDEFIELDNFINYEDFMKPTTKPFIRGITCYIIDKLLRKHKHVVKNIEYIKLISTRVADDIQTLQKYLTDYTKSGYYDTNFGQEAKRFMESAVLMKPDLDPKVNHIIVKLETELEILDFIKYFKTEVKIQKSRYSYSEDKIIDTGIIDPKSIIVSSFYLKHPANHKFLLNLEHYQTNGLAKYYNDEEEKNNK